MSDALVLDDANLRLAKLYRVRFDGCVLTGAELVSAQLEEVAFPTRHRVAEGLHDRRRPTLPKWHPRSRTHSASP